MLEPNYQVILTLSYVDNILLFQSIESSKSGINNECSQ
jgi:hypothetical protein